VPKHPVSAEGGNNPASDQARQADAAHKLLAEPLIAFAVATAAASALYWTALGSSFVYENLHGLIAVMFLYIPWLAGRLGRKPFDYARAGVRLNPLKPALTTLSWGLTATWPLFLAGFYVFYVVACDSGGASIIQWRQLWAPLCPRWTGIEGAYLHLPPEFVTLALSQLIVVALPEELFFRGYLHARIEAIWPSKRRFFGAPVGPSLLVTSLLFAFGHVLVDFDVRRLAVFFPGLVFAWMRARSGTIVAGTVYHALCNLLSDVLHRTFFV